ncbi:MAG: hypothetical protein GX321_04980 [Clostridiales bacterium]|mgnify:CR=1 FL=1|nr:hypothetical protein [Clostridiales bacterium]
MKEKLNGFTRGEFEYELPSLYSSVEEINISIEAGKQFEGSFIIGNSINRNMKGILYSSSRLLTFECNTFSGKDNNITYTFDASYLNPSDVVKGNIAIVSDCGEIIVPIMVTILAPAITTSIGKIKNLFEFANLARMDWTEAKKVFRSEEFKKIVLKNEERFHIVYQNLVKSISTSQALEEFLIAVNKKSKVNLTTENLKLEYHITNENVMDKLVITKDNWGYAEIRVSTDAPFIQLEQKFLWADSFIGNNHNISFIINADKLRPGNNYGFIWIKTVYQEITVEVVCRKHSTNTAKVPNFRSSMTFSYKLSRSYLDFRIGRITIDEYAKLLDSFIYKMKAPQENMKVKLIQTHLAIISDNKREAAKLLEEISQQETTLRKQSTIEYCAYLYLLALYKKDDDTIQYVTDTISRYYSRGNYDWRILWFLLFTDKRYDRNRNYKLIDIKEQYDAGSISPILYYEAICVYKEEPYLLRELSDFEIQVMNFGIKYDFITMDLALQYTYLASRLKFYHPIVFRGLTKLYRIYKKDEILSAICSLLIKGHKRDNKYFHWYKQGVESQLRITELYEYYMYSVDENWIEPLPQPLLLYFIYNSSLNDKKRAYLYANIVINKNKNEQMYQSYYKKMEIFAAKQLEAKNINGNLGILYKEFMDKPAFSNIIVENMPDVMFTREIYCDNPNMISVIVVHKEQEGEETVPLNQGRANVDIYTDDAKIFLVDGSGNRYVASVDYKLTPLLSPTEINNLSLDYENHPKLLLNMLDYYQRNRVFHQESIEIRKRSLLLPALKETYYVDSLLTIIDYYYDNYNTDLLEKYLHKLDLTLVNENDRIKYLEYMIIRGFYDYALEAIKCFRVKGISINSLLKLCSGWIASTGLDEYEEHLLSLCYYIYSQGKYNITILNYLVKYYEGSTLDMFSLWNEAMNFEVDAHDLEERLLKQILFTESLNKDTYKIFFDYYSKVNSHQLVRAFLTYCSYKYLVHDIKIDKGLFPIIRRELNYEENYINLLAWIKFNTNNRKLSDNDKKFISYNIDRFERQGMILPFFQKYKSIIELPERIIDKTYIEYKTDPKKQVFLHYKVNKNNHGSQYIVECMPNVLLGIHVKEFVLFYNEDIEYYITEESEEEVISTSSLHLTYDKENDLDEDTKFNRINMMLMALDIQDTSTLLEMMEAYVKSEFIIDECFKPLP